MDSNEDNVDFSKFFDDKKVAENPKNSLEKPEAFFEEEAPKKKFKFNKLAIILIVVFLILLGVEIVLISVVRPAKPQPLPNAKVYPTHKK